MVRRTALFYQTFDSPLYGWSVSVTMSGLVLAGGSSRRMGTDKAQMVVRGELLVSRAVRTLSEVCAEVVVASGDGHRLDHLGLTQVADVMPDAGPLAGIAAGLAAARHPVVAVVAVDMPDISAPLLRFLAGLWDGAWDGAGNGAWDGPAALVPVVDGRWQPLHAVYARSAAPGIVSFLRGGGRSVRRALAALGARPVEPDVWAAAVPDGRFAVNLNAPEDLE